MYRRHLAFIVLFLGLLFAYSSTTQAQVTDCNQDGSTTAADITCVILGIFAPPDPDVNCPCDFDLEFWTNPNWSIEDNALFGSCFDTSVDKFLLGTTDVHAPPDRELECRAILRVTKGPLLGNLTCTAELSCDAFNIDGGGLVMLFPYFDQSAFLDTSQMNACEEDIERIAQELGIPCDG